MKELSGRVAFITGSAGGIGLGIARACLDQGMKVVLSDIDVETLEHTAEELKRDGADVLALPLDVTNRDEWASAAENVSRQRGPVQLLVNNAGVSTNGLRFGEVTPAIWDSVMAINLTSVYNGVHFFADGMRSAGEGHIVNTASIAGLKGLARLSPYSATKAAIVALSESLQTELAKENIGVSVLCPGPVQSRLWRTSRPIKGLADTDIPPQDLTAQSALPTSMDPYEVGQRVLDGVLRNDLYIFTHPEFREYVTERTQRMNQAFDRAESFIVNQ
jgi:NAD(P)-dependent dehydrogenase (short-subunit alcohol dehydrogenase family)